MNVRLIFVESADRDDRQHRARCARRRGRRSGIRTRGRRTASAGWSAWSSSSAFSGAPCAAASPSVPARTLARHRPLCAPHPRDRWGVHVVRTSRAVAHRRHPRCDLGGVVRGPARLLTPLSYLADSVSSSVAPRQVANPREGPDVAAFKAGLRWLIIVHAAMLAPLIVWARADRRPVLGHAVLGIARGPSSARAVCLLARRESPDLEYGHLPRSRCSADTDRAGRIGDQRGGEHALLPRYRRHRRSDRNRGGLRFYVPAHFRICRRELQLPLSDRWRPPCSVPSWRRGRWPPCCSPWGRARSLGQWLLGGAAGLAAYAAALLVSGELSDDRDPAHPSPQRETAGGRRPRRQPRSIATASHAPERSAIRRVSDAPSEPLRIRGSDTDPSSARSTPGPPSGPNESRRLGRPSPRARSNRRSGS